MFLSCASCLPLLCSGGSVSTNYGTFLSQWVPCFYLPMPHLEITISEKLSWAWNWADQMETIELWCIYQLKEHIFFTSLLPVLKYIFTNECLQACVGAKATMQSEKNQLLWSPAWLPHHLVVLRLPGSNHVWLRQVWKCCPLFFFNQIHF